MKNKAVTQYLQRYAEPEIRLLTGLPATTYRHILVIPAYKESRHFLQHLIRSSCFDQGALLILIINQPDTAVDNSKQQALHDYLVRHSRRLWKNQHLELLAPTPDKPDDNNCGHILLINRYSAPLPEKQGVGLARKIGSDIALALIQRGIIQTEWINTSDADATLPDNYFSALSVVESNAVATNYAFKHTGGNPEVNAAALNYERALHYYVTGLKYAGSPYAFHTIGSTLAFKAQAYAEVRGFPRRAAGEDFYLLNKLAKIGQIACIREATIQLEARISDRVPFGTGASTAKIIQLHQNDETFLYYHPEVFTALKEVLTHFETLQQRRTNPTDWLENLPTPSATALTDLGLVGFLEKNSRQNHSPKHFTAQLAAWFDALKTLRFIHSIRDQQYPNLSLDEALTLANFSLDK